MHVSWNGAQSRSFSCSNGVKQGGVLSPLLFCVYVDELLVRLQSLNCGCYIGNSFVGAFGYADDLSLLAPSLVAAKLMLSVCEDFSKDYDVMFNAGKSGHLVFHNAPVNLQKINPLSLNGVTIPKVESALLLGTNIGSGKVVHDFSKAVGEMTYRTNLLLARFSRCDSHTLSRLFRTYCLSLYGSPLWALDNASLTRLGVCWRRCLKRIWRISPRTHTHLIHRIDQCSPLKQQLMSRFLTFFVSCVNSKNPVLSLLINVAQCSYSTVGLNIRELLYELNSPHLNCNTHPDTLKKKLSKFYSNGDDHVVCLGIAIRDLCSFRDSKDYSFGNHDELVFLITLLCTY